MGMHLRKVMEAASEMVGRNKSGTHEDRCGRLLVLVF
jgi:hypothetical protein